MRGESTVDVRLVLDLSKEGDKSSPSTSISEELVGWRVLEGVLGSFGSHDENII